MSRYNERSAGLLEGIVIDSFGTPVPGSDVTAFTMTIWDIDTAQQTSPVEGIINDRHDYDVLGSSEVTISESGAFSIKLSADDNIVVTKRRQVERHSVTVHCEFETDSGIGVFNQDIEIEVKRVPRRTT